MAEPLKCRYCGATGRTSLDPALRGLPFKSAFSLMRHERVCIKNPNRTRYHKQRRAPSSPNSTLKIIGDLPGGGLLCVDTRGNFYNALRVRINVEMTR